MKTIGLNLYNDLTIDEDNNLTVKIDPSGILEIREDGLYVGQSSDDDDVVIVPEATSFSSIKLYSNKSVSIPITNSYHSVFDATNEIGDGITGDIFPGDFYRVKSNNKYRYYIITSVVDNKVSTYSFLKEV